MFPFSILSNALEDDFSNVEGDVILNGIINDFSFYNYFRFVATWRKRKTNKNLLDLTD